MDQWYKKKFYGLIILSALLILISNEIPLISAGHINFNNYGTHEQEEAVDPNEEFKNSE